MSRLIVSLMPTATFSWSLVLKTPRTFFFPTSAVNAKGGVRATGHRFPFTGPAMFDMRATWSWYVNKQYSELWLNNSYQDARQAQMYTARRSGIRYENESGRGRIP